MKREYHLTDAGRERLRATIARRKPWKRSTGPRTAAGKARSGQNARKHGARSRATVALVRLGQAMERVDAIRASVTPDTTSRAWASAVAAVKLELSDAADHATDLVEAGDAGGVGRLFLAALYDSDCDSAWAAFYKAFFLAVMAAAQAGHAGAYRLMGRIIYGDLSGIRTRPRRAGQARSA